MNQFSAPNVAAPYPAAEQLSRSNDDLWRPSGVSIVLHGYHGSIPAWGAIMPRLRRWFGSSMEKAKQ